MTQDRHHDEQRGSAKKLQVFISSPFDGMEVYRRGVMEGVVRAGHVPIALENFSFSNESDTDVILAALESCQVYILILGERYGQTIGPEVVGSLRRRLPDLHVDEGISFTELEFRIALHLKAQHQLVVYVVRFDEKAVKQRRRRREVDGRHLEPLEKAQTDEKYWRFYHRVAGERSFGKPFDPDMAGSPKILALEIQASLHQLDTTGLRGWVRELEGVSPDLYQRLSKSPLTQSIIEALGRFESLDERTAREANLKQRASQFFWYKYSKSILDRRANLFLESGSTVAYAAHHIGPALEGARTLRTNNVLAQMLLWIKDRRMCEVFPAGFADPNDKFGATFGEHIDRLEAGRPDLVPGYFGDPLEPDEQAAIDAILAEPDSPQHWGKPALLLGAISGIQVSDRSAISYSDECARTEDLDVRIRAYRGFHVGSYKNKIFKRFMYATGVPVLILADESKLDCAIRAGKCHFIFDREFSWTTFLRDHPVAFCIAYHRTAKEPHRMDLAEPFKALGFTIIEDEGTTTYGAFIARNRAFESAFPHE